MAGYLNKVMLIGNLGRDPEIRHAQDGMKIANFSLATSEYWKDKATGERKDKTEWHRVVIFNDKLVDIIEQYIKKGSKVYLEGQLQTRKWTDQHGIEKYTTEIVLSRFNGVLTMLDSKGTEFTSSVEAKPASSFATSQNSPKNNDENFEKLKELDDNIPF